MISKGTPVEVTWTDTISDNNMDWADLEDMKPLPPVHPVTLGIVLEDTETYITVCSTVTYENHEVNSMFARVTIPKCCIIDINELQYRNAKEGKE